uniref:Autophagy-related protein 13 n=2 Tax=Anthurium amnicola TaxID=1678845 RepID=A0A1D1Y6Q9_9ARAE
MASPQCNAHSHSEAPMVEQIITEFFAKSLHIILESRSPCVSSRNYYSGEPSTSSPSSSSSTSSIRPRDKWFNLALGDCPDALENMDLWAVGNFEPLVIDVSLVQRPSDFAQSHPPPGGCLVRNISAKDRYPNYCSLGQDEMVTERSVKIIERWIVQYESRKSAGSIRREPNMSGKRSSSGSSHFSEMSPAQRKVYNSSIILLRSLYVTVRLLPAYKIFRDLSSTGQIRSFSLAHRISSFVEPFTRVEDAEMNQFSFVPVDTPCGRLCLSVSYLPTLEDVSSEPSTPLSAQLIPDYVGSPLAEPLKRFECLPSAAPVPTYVSFTRRHSWSNGHRATPSISPSPSPTHSDSRALYQNMNHDLPLSGQITIGSSPPKSLISDNATLVYKRTTSFDEHCPSPPILPSPSPSPPPHFLSRNSLNALMRTESASDRIPSTHRNDALPPSPSPKGPRARYSERVDSVRAQACAASASRPSPRAKPERRLGEFQSGITLQKDLPRGKDDARILPGGVMTSCASPRLLHSSSSSRVSMLDEFENFLCPFVEDDDFSIDPSEERGQVAEGLGSGRFLPVRRSQGAAVGELVIMLKSAPPLHQDLSKLETLSQSSKDNRDKGIKLNKDAESPVAPQNAHSGSGIVGSALLRSRTTSDALEELRNYREMKDSLLRQGVSQSSEVPKAVKSADDVSS